MAEPTWDDLYVLGKAALQSRRPTLAVREGDVSDAILAATATVGTVILARTNRQFLDNFLDGAAGEALTSRAEDRGVTRNAGSRAVGSVTFSRPTAGAGAGVIPSGFRLGTTEGSTLAPLQPTVPRPFTILTTDDDTTFGPSDLTKTMTCTALLVGRAGNAEPGAVSRLLEEAFDPSIVVTNPLQFAGGSETESDPDLRDHVRGFFLTQARGTIDALDFGARQVPGVTRVTVSADGSGVVIVYVADADGNSNPTLVAAVARELEHWRAAGDVVFVTGGVITLVAIDLSLTVRSGTDVNALIGPVRQSVIAALGRLNPGEELDRGYIEFHARSVDKERIAKVGVLAPLANIVPGPTELLRTNDGLVNFP